MYPDAFSVTGEPAGNYWAEPFDPGLRGYLPVHCTNPYTIRILSMLLHAPYSSPSMSLMNSEYFIIIADIRLFVKGEMGYFWNRPSSRQNRSAKQLCLDISGFLL